MEGGAPAGSSLPTGFLGCRATSISMTIITIHGKRRTVPKGTEILELPFKRILLRKKASLGVIRSF